MMLAYRLLRLIETHYDALATGLQQRLQESDKTSDFRKVPPADFKAAVSEIYRHLGEWLLGKTESEIERRYVEIGARRRQQGVRFSQLVWAIVLTKEYLWEYLKKEALPEKPVEVFGELEVFELLDQFFDRAIYYAGIGYEQELAAEPGKKVEELAAAR